MLDIFIRPMFYKTYMIVIQFLDYERNPMSVVWLHHDFVDSMQQECAEDLSDPIHNFMSVTNLYAISEPADAGAIFRLQQMMKRIAAIAKLEEIGD